MRNLFRLTKANSEDAISFINYAPIRKTFIPRPRTKIHQIIASRHGFDPKWKTLSKTGTRSKTAARGENL